MRTIVAAAGAGFRLLLLLTTCSPALQAQLCPGGLGDPVVNISFGAGQNPGPALPGKVTHYTYITGSCPNDGEYTLVNNSQGCFNSTWHLLAQDHTEGDGNGYMMLVNASLQPGDFYVDTVHNLCGNTTYEFAAWIVNVLKPSSCGGNGSRPNVSFRIETTGGQVLQSFSTGNIEPSAQPAWKQYGFFFQTPANISSVVLRMTNHAQGGCGNDLALDDITFRACGPQLTAQVQGQPGTVVNACQGSSGAYTLQGTVSAPGGGMLLQWQHSFNGGAWTDLPGATQWQLGVQPQAAGEYRYRLTTATASNMGMANCRIASNPVSIVIHGPPAAALPPGLEGCEGAPFSFPAISTGTVQWSGPAGFQSAQNPLAFPALPAAAAGPYMVTVTDAYGCVGKDTVLLTVAPAPMANAGSDTTVCQGDVFSLQGSGNGAAAWTPAAPLQQPAQFHTAGTLAQTTVFTLTVSTASTCRVQDQVTVTVVRKPQAHAGPDKLLVEGQSITLEGSVSGDGISYFWLPQQFITSSQSLQPVVSPTRDITYRLYAESAFGCAAAMDEVFVRVVKKITVPNAFSPNGDGVHDLWQIEALAGFPQAELRVYNRLGVKVFESRGYAKPWNGTHRGKPLPPGIYYYTLDPKEILPPVSGWVLLLR